MSQDTGYICPQCGQPATQVVGDLEPVCQDWPGCPQQLRPVEQNAIYKAWQFTANWSFWSYKITQRNL